MNVSILAIVSLAGIACQTSQNKESSTRASSLTMVEGYTESGILVRKAAQTSGQLCPSQFDPFEHACENAGGQPLHTRDCKILCSIRVSGTPANKVTQGYNEQGRWVSRPVAQPSTLCPAQVSDFSQKCQAVSGNVIVVENCGELCSQPVGGVIEGFDENGQLQRLPIPSPQEVCPTVVSEFSVNCRNAEGTVLNIAGCRELCSTRLQ